ncbi:MAG: aminodeoxychorismate synthase component I [Candidatus Omnitrophota bacterium]
MASYIWKSYKFDGDPYDIFYILRGRKNCFFLDSGLRRDKLGRYSFIGCDPFCVLKPGKEDPFTALRKILDLYRICPLENMPPFLGGAVGFFGYDLGFSLEKRLKKTVKDDVKTGDYFFGFYDTVIAIDHYAGSMSIFSCGFPETKSSLIQARAQERLKEVERILLMANCVRLQKCFIKKKASRVDISSNFSEQGYIRAIKKVKEYIKAGDIYQLNLSQRFSAETVVSAEEIYAKLRSLSPADFSAYLDCGDFQIISSSPERFLSLDKKVVYTRPMKGTRPRSSNKDLDRKLKSELLSSPKDMAELLMIVDLERNDLGKVCEYGSVRVDALREIEEYKTVFQTTATVEGVLHKNKDRLDLIRACFPGGSITGCPKIRSMEIIEELEPTRRSVYTGSMGYLSFCGNMDLNILIRTILKKDNTLYFQAGGGIVADSKPDEEYRETLVKARAMFEAIK